MLPLGVAVPAVGTGGIAHTIMTRTRRAGGTTTISPVISYLTVKCIMTTQMSAEHTSTMSTGRSGGTRRLTAQTLRRSIRWAAPVVMALMMTACSDTPTPTSTPNVPPSENEGTDVYMNENGVLVFSSMDAFLRIAMHTEEGEGLPAGPEIKDLVPEFTSMRSVFDQFQQDEPAAFEAVAPTDEPANAEDYLKLSATAQAHSDMILAKRYPDDNLYRYEMNIGNERLADAVTPNGEVWIADELYTFTEDAVTVSPGDGTSRALTADEKSIFGYGERSGDLFGKPIAATGYTCNNSWTKGTTATNGDRRATILLVFAQGAPTATPTINVSTLDFSIKVQKRVAWIWFATSPSYQLMEGQFSGPRSPKASNGVSYGYVYSNPFQLTGGSSLRHFNDYSSNTLPCFSMTHATYKATVTANGKTMYPNITW